MARYLDGAETASREESLALIAAARAVPTATVQSVATAGGPQAPLAAEAATKISPGSERWPVKTGTDDDIDEVAKKIVGSTVRELGSLPRPAALMPDTGLHDDYDSKRVEPVEVTIWSVKAKVIAMKLEADGDYHLVLQDESGAEMVAEIPYPDDTFIKTTSPFFDDVKAARGAVNQQFGQIMATLNFVPSGTDAKLVPDTAVLPNPQAAPAQPKKIALVSDSTDAFKDSDLFSARIDPADATITGVGFFDRAHGQTGAAPNIVELHPVLDITFS